MIRYGIAHYFKYREFVDPENIYDVSGSKHEFMYDRLLVWDTFYWKGGQEDLGRKEKRFRRLIGFKSSFNLPIWRCSVSPNSYVWCLSYNRRDFAVKMDQKTLHLLFPPKISPEDVEIIIGHLYTKIVNPIAIKRLRLKSRWFKN